MKCKSCNKKLSGKRRKFCNDNCNSNFRYHTIDKKKPLYNRKRKIWTKYRIRYSDYEAMLVSQNKRCAICDEVKDLVIDHDHKTGKVRGLLCVVCNTKLGVYEKWKDRFKVYLERTN